MSKISDAHRRFREWAEAYPGSRTQLAAELGCDTSYVSRLCAGEKWPGRRIANAIERLSKGAIRSTDWDEAEEAAAIRPTGTDAA